MERNNQGSLKLGIIIFADASELDSVLKDNKALPALSTSSTDSHSIPESESRARVGGPADRGSIGFKFIHCVNESQVNRARGHSLSGATAPVSHRDWPWHILPSRYSATDSA